MSKTGQAERWRRRLGIAELEVRLNVSRSTISRWVRAGLLPRPHHLGRDRQWYADEIESFEQSRIGATEAVAP